LAFHNLRHSPPEATHRFCGGAFFRGPNLVFPIRRYSIVWPAQNVVKGVFIVYATPFAPPRDVLPIHDPILAFPSRYYDRTAAIKIDKRPAGLASSI